MSRIEPNTLHDFITGETVTENLLDTIFEIIRVSINDNYDRIASNYTRAQIDQIITDSQAGVVLDNSITTAKLAPQAVTKTKIAPGIVDETLIDQTKIPLIGTSNQSINRFKAMPVDVSTRGAYVTGRNTANKITNMEIRDGSTVVASIVLTRNVIDNKIDTVVCTINITVPVITLSYTINRDAKRRFLSLSKVVS